MVNLDKIWVKCPKCGKNLFKVDYTSRYENIYVWCKHCKKEITIKEPKSRVMR